MSEAITIPECLHLCPRCEGLASGGNLCEDCVAVAELAKKLDRDLRRQHMGNVRDWVAVVFLYLGFCAYLGAFTAGACWVVAALARVTR